jgi:ubiquinone/menaquinone biosynthesis C-methylase UbiE
MGSMDDYYALKDRLIADVSGTVLEIGAGRGRNLPKYSRGVRWIGLEPDEKRCRQLGKLAESFGQHEPVLCSGAEAIPLPDNSVDAVVATVVLCSVDQPAQVLSEVQRVLRPGGVFVFFEHVIAPPGTWFRRFQHFAAPFSRRFDHGCDPTRETWHDIEAAGFAKLDLRWFKPQQRLSIEARYIGGQAWSGE